jgi:hypothetical protein
MKHDSQQENSVVLAFAELHRLERDRAAFVDAKRAANEQLGRQAREIETLRSRLLAERPRARARIQREQARLRRMREREEAALLARAESEHRERLALYQAELEAKRLHLATLEATPSTKPPARRVLEWSVPAAATALVAFLGFFALGEEQAVAQAADPWDTFELLNAEEPVFQAPSAATIPYAAPLPEPVMPEPKPEPKSGKKKSGKKKSGKKAKESKKPKTKKPVVKKRSNPLELGDFNGNPLG